MLDPLTGYFTVTRTNSNIPVPKVLDTTSLLPH